MYDWIDKWGGVERLLLHLHSLFPQAHFFTSALGQSNAGWAKNLSVTPSFIQHIPSCIRSHRPFILPLYPLAFEAFQFDDYDLVVSVTSSFAKGIITKPHTEHICYLLTPPRYLWSHTNDYTSSFTQFAAAPLLAHLRNWDTASSHRPDRYLSISHEVAKRARSTYHVESLVLYPPFDTLYWDTVQEKMKKPEGLNIQKPYYLWVGRMERYKKPELFVEAARHLLGSTFIMVGIGTELSRLKAFAPPNCYFTEFVSDEELSYLYSHARALVMPQIEDFGYVSLEAQYHGCPVIAYRAGGAVETIKEEETGLFFNEQTVPSLVSQLERCEQISYNLSHSTQHGKKRIRDEFGIERFNNQFRYQLNYPISL